MVFSLRIELGNEAMQTGADIAGALHELAGRVATFAEDTNYDRGRGWPGTAGPIRDVNGNTVGSWEVV